MDVGNGFPEIKLHAKRIMDSIALEEKSFDRTLINGIARFKKAAKDVRGKHKVGRLHYQKWALGRMHFFCGIPMASHWI